MCLLTGPAGCGKTATIRALSQDMNFEILEWTNSVTRSAAIPFSTTDGQQMEPNQRHFYYEPSQTKQFSDFLNRANRYPSILLEGNSTNELKEKKIVLIEVLIPIWRGYTEVYIVYSDSPYPIVWYENAILVYYCNVAILY